MTDEPDASVWFVENGQVGIRKFTCTCGHDIISRDDERRSVVAQPHCDDPLTCDDCGAEWEPNIGLTFENTNDK